MADDSTVLIIARKRPVNKGANEARDLLAPVNRSTVRFTLIGVVLDSFRLEIELLAVRRLPDPLLLGHGLGLVAPPHFCPRTHPRRVSARGSVTSLLVRAADSSRCRLSSPAPPLLPLRRQRGRSRSFAPCRGARQSSSHWLGTIPSVSPIYGGTARHGNLAGAGGQCRALLDTPKSSLSRVGGGRRPWLISNEAAEAYRSMRVLGVEP